MVNSSDCPTCFEQFIPVKKGSRELRSMIRMHSSILNSPRHHHSPTITPPPIHRIRSSTYPATSNIGSNPFFLSQPSMDHVLEQESDSSSTTSNPEAEKILRNSLYLTFNAPQVDEYVLPPFPCQSTFNSFRYPHGKQITKTIASELTSPKSLIYLLTQASPHLRMLTSHLIQHRGIFLTHPPAPSIPDPRYSGTLFHASYTSPDSSNPSLPPKWLLEQRVVKDVSSSQSLVLLYRIGTLSTSSNVTQQFHSIRQVLESVPLGRENRERKVGPLKEAEGNQVLGGYDCVIWTRDAVAALADAGLINLGEKLVETVMAESRAMAGPVDARTMVGVDFGGFRVFN